MDSLRLATNVLTIVLDVVLIVLIVRGWKD